MSAKVKNQHYIPQMYLNLFSTNDNRLCVWNLSTDQVLDNQSSRNFASSKYFYDTNSEDLKELISEIASVRPKLLEKVDLEDEQFVEKELGRMEGDVAGIIRDITQDHSKIYEKVVEQKLIIFLHDLAYRTENPRKEIEMVKNATIHHSTQNNIAQAAKDSAKKTQLYYLHGLKPLLDTAHMLKEKYDWYIGVVSGKYKLLISDDPAKGIRLGFNDICIPISGDLAIIFRAHYTAASYISKDTPTNGEITLSERSVFVYNAWQRICAKRFMFGDKKTIEFIKSKTKNL